MNNPIIIPIKDKKDLSTIWRSFKKSPQYQTSIEYLSSQFKRGNDNIENLIEHHPILSYTPEVTAGYNPQISSSYLLNRALILDKLPETNSITAIYFATPTTVRTIQMNPDYKERFSYYIPHTTNPIQYTEGDCLELDTELLVHGVACADVEDMGTGIARQINFKWPESYRRFKKYRRDQTFDPGNLFIDCQNMPNIGYMGTQENLNEARINHVNNGLRNLAKRLKMIPYTNLLIPKIGCGYGKLNWTEVKPLVESHLANLFTNIIVVEKYKPKKK